MLIPEEPKKIALSIMVITIFAITSCGGGSGGDEPTPTPTPTSTSTKVTSEAVVEAVNFAVFQTIVSMLQNMGPTAMVVKDASGKEAFQDNFTYTYECPVSGTVQAAGTVSGTFTESGGNWSVTGTDLSMSLDFQACTVTVTQDGTSYEETVDGPGSATASGSATGTGDSLPNLNFTGNGTGTVEVTGDIIGTAVLDISAVVTGVPNPMPDVTCSGTVDVTSDLTTQTCTVSSDCSGCEL